MPLEGLFGCYDFDVAPCFLVSGDRDVGEGVVFRVAEDNVVFAEVLEIDDGPLGEPLDEEIVVLSNVAVIWSYVRPLVFPLFASL